MIFWGYLSLLAILCSCGNVGNSLYFSQNECSSTKRNFLFWALLFYDEQTKDGGQTNTLKYISECVKICIVHCRVAYFTVLLQFCVWFVNTQTTQAHKFLYVAHHKRRACTLQRTVLMESLLLGTYWSHDHSKYVFPSPSVQDVLSHLPINLVYRNLYDPPALNATQQKHFFLRKLLTASCSLATFTFKAAPSLWIQRLLLASSRDILAFAERKIPDRCFTLKICLRLHYCPCNRGVLWVQQAQHLCVLYITAFKFFFNLALHCFAIPFYRDLELTGIF